MMAKLLRGLGWMLVFVLGLIMFVAGVWMYNFSEHPFLASTMGPFLFLCGMMAMVMTFDPLLEDIETNIKHRRSLRGVIRDDGGK